MYFQFDLLLIMRFFFLIIILLLYSQESKALEQLKIEANSSPKHSRIIFFCKQPVGFSATLKGSSVHIKFNRNFVPNFSSLLNNTKDFIIGATANKEGNTIILALNNSNYTIRKFFGDKSVGIELIKQDNKTSTATAKTQTKPTPLTKSKEKPQEKPKNKLSTTRTNINTKTQLLSDKSDTKNSVDTTLETTKTLAKTTDTLLIQNPNISDKKSDSPNIANNNISSNGKLTFPWDYEVASAAFYQSGYLWILFNQKININLEAIKANSNFFIQDIQELDIPDNTILYIKTNADPNKIAFYKEKYNWILEFNQQPLIASANAQLILQNFNPEMKNIFFPAVNGAKPIKFTQPITGNTILVIPFYSMDSKVPQTRHFIDFTLLATIQGFAIDLISDHVQLINNAKGIEILSVNTKMPQAQEFAGIHSTNNHTDSLLPFTEWVNLVPGTFIPTRQTLQENIIKAKGLEKPKAIFKLAQMFLGRKFFKEAAGVTEYIDNLYPDFTQNLNFKLLQAVAFYLNQKEIEAKILLDNIPLEEIPTEYQDEIQFWQNTIMLSLGIPNPLYDFLHYKDSFLKTYPITLICKLAFLDIRASFIANRLDHIKQILDYFSNLKLNTNPETQKCYNSMQFYSGLYAHKSGNDKKALKIWSSLTNNLGDRLNRAKATFSTTKLLYESDKLTLDEAISRLDKLRNVWRGNKLDNRLLRYLAELYEKNHNYAQTLRVWDELVKAFPRSPDIFFIKSQMSKLFVSLFQKNGLANNMPPFQAVSLFFEFYNLLPIGKLGDDITQNIAYMLVQLDLLEKAEALLNHAVSYRLTGEDRARVGAKLALIYLLDKKPTKVIEILNKTYHPNISPLLQTQRNYLKAQAFIENKKLEQALDLLNNDNSDEAYHLKTRILWLQRNCEKLEHLTIAKLDKSIPNFSSRDEENLLHLLLCYTTTQKQSNADTVYYTFKNYISPSSKLYSTFEFIMGENNPIDISNLVQSLDINSIESFLEKFKSSLLAP
ncbi:hypothetical protein NOVO_03080 [Rickettsiales bacterium Ac37b]|nr:hypothetical protein NOVO_03080 [Rickettsiales bacterium Ac37b]